ncbi:MAG: YcfL family protein [Verrucomicrobiae bacterium]|nr:YcfL family protein [Verrucomicrobiae bacterium]
MNAKYLLLIPLLGAMLATGCRTHDRGPYLPENSKQAAYENTERFVLLDPGTQYSVTCSGINERTLEDGRLEITALLRNRENRRIEIQANCVFKDGNMMPIDDETPFQAVILTENATEAVKFTSMNNRAKKYTVRVRQAR